MEQVQTQVQILIQYVIQLRDLDKTNTATIAAITTEIDRLASTLVTFNATNASAYSAMLTSIAGE